MNEQIIALINDFSKANKTSKEKLMALAEAIIALDHEKPKAKPLKENNGRVGKPVSELSLKLREAVKALANTELKDKHFTIEDLRKKLSSEIDASAVYLNNAVRFLTEKEGLFKPVGKQDKQPGQRGPKAIIWSVA